MQDLRDGYDGGYGDNIGSPITIYQAWTEVIREGKGSLDFCNNHHLIEKLLYS